MWNGENGHMDGSWGLLMVFGMVAFWGLIAIAVIWVITTNRTARLSNGVPPAHGSATSDRGPTAGAEQILAERLAHGEIDAEEYAARLKVLTAPRRS